MSGSRPKCECPSCGVPLDIVAAVGVDQRWTLKLHSEAPGGFLQAATVAGAIDGAQKMMRASCRADGANVNTYVESISTGGDGTLEIKFITMVAKKANRKKP